MMASLIIQVIPISLLLIGADFSIGQFLHARRETTPTPSRNLVIVTTDGGADDATALIQILERSDYQVLAIVCSYGNVPLNQSCDNTRRTLQLMGKANTIPVYAGCGKSFIREETYDGYYGYDGFGNNSEEFPLPSEPVREQHGANAINSYASLYPGEITLLSLGPTTDLAVAVKLDPTLPSKLKQLYIMGGSSRGIGNIQPVAEFNVYLDPESTKIVLAEFDCPITVAPYELCTDYAQSWEWFDSWVAPNTSIAYFIGQAFAVARQNGIENGESFQDCDLMASTAFLYPELVTDQAEKHADVETCGQLTVGEFVVDNREGDRGDTNVNMLLTVDQQLVLDKWQELIYYDVARNQVRRSYSSRQFGQLS